jgi:hypothetical protein
MELISNAMDAIFGWHIVRDIRNANKKEPEVVDDYGNPITCYFNDQKPCVKSCAFFLDRSQEMITSIARDKNSMQTTRCGFYGAMMSLAYEPQRMMRMEWTRLLEGKK